MIFDQYENFKSENSFERREGPGRKRLDTIDDLLEKARLGDFKKNDKNRQAWRI